MPSLSLEENEASCGSLPLSSLFSLRVETSI